MKVHFMGDPGGVKEDYRLIIALIESQGHTVVTDHILHVSEEDITEEQKRQAEKEYVRNSRKWVRQADAVVFEVSKPSISIGFEIADAYRFYRKAVILLYRGPEPVLNALRGLRSYRMQIEPYDDDDLEELLSHVLEEAANKGKDRFHLVIPPSMRDYLDWRDHNTRISRSEFLRTLIEEEMKDDTEYWKSLE